MTKKSTYKLTEVARKLGKMRKTVVDWSNQFREFLPTIGAGSSLRYTDEALAAFKIISRLKDDNRSNKYIKDYLKNWGQEDVIAMKEFDMPSKPLFPSVQTANTNNQLSKETVELRNAIQTLAQRIDATKAPAKPQNQDLTEKAVIAGIPLNEVELHPEVELRAMIEETTNSLNKRYDSMTEEVKELRSLILILTKKIKEVMEQNTSYQKAVTEEWNQRYVGMDEAMNKQYGNVTEEIAELRSLIQLLMLKISEVLEQDLRSEIAQLRKENQLLRKEIAALEESMNSRFEELVKQIAAQQSLIDQYSKILVWNPS